MKYTHPSLRWVSLPSAALAMLLGACGGDDSTPPPNNPPPPMDASNTADQSTGTPDVKTTFDAGTTMCGTSTCSGAIVGGQIGVACCAGPMMNRCGLQFLGSTQCIDQSDAGGFNPPPGDAGPITPDPSCGTISITFGGMTFPLDGCCRAEGVCGWYSPAAPGQGCASAEQISRIPGTTVPDAPIACSGEGGTRPDTGAPDTGRPDTNTPDSTTPPTDGGTPDGTGGDAASDATTSDATADTTTTDTTTTDTAADTGTQPDGTAPEAGND